MTWISERALDTAGWTILHSLWELALLAAALWALLRSLPHRAPGTRYAAAVTGLAAMVACVAFSATALWQRTQTFSPVETALPAPAPSAPATALLPPPRYAPVAGALQLPPPSRETQAMRWLLGAYAIGAAACALRLLYACLSVRRLRRCAILPERALLLQMQRLARRMAIGPTRVRMSAAIDTPMIVGVLRPLVLVPLIALTGLSPSQLEALLIHELAHLRRRDHILNLLQSIVEILLFYHPAVWWLSCQIREERECCCDEVAVMLLGDRAHYARALAAMEEMRVPISTSVALASRGGTLLRRVQRMLRQPQTPSHRFAAPLAAAVGILTLATALYLLGCGRAPSHPLPSAGASNPSATPEPLPYADLVTPQPPSTRPDLRSSEWPSDSPENKAAAAKLEQPIDFSSAGESLERALLQLSQTAGVNIFANWKVLDTVGIKPTTQVAINVHDAPAKKVISELLNAVGGTEPLRYVVDDGVVTISTQEDFQSQKYRLIRVFDIRDFLVAVPQGKLELPKDGSKPATMSDKERQEYQAMVVHEVTNTIETIVAPDSWTDKGGKVGSIREFNGQLIVSQTEENQRAVYNLLNQLREGRRVQIRMESQVCLLTADALGPLVAAHKDIVQKGKPVLVAEKESAEVTKALQQTTTFRTSPMTLFNGQVTDITLNRPDPKQPAAHAQPTGFAAALEMTASPDRKAVVLHAKLGTPATLGTPADLAETDLLTTIPENSFVLVNAGTTVDEHGTQETVIWLLRPRLMVLSEIDR